MKNNNVENIILLLLIFLIFQSCNKPITSIVEEWNQKKIQIPESLNFKSCGQDIDGLKVLNHKFKILYYLDSLGCTTCRLQLLEWKSYMKLCKSRGYDVGFLFVVEVKKVEEFESKLNMHHFTYPIVYDPNGEFDKINKLPKDERFRTFLLDDENRVVLIGSPIKNKKIMKLYESVLGDGKIRKSEQNDKTTNNKSINKSTTIELSKDYVNLGKFSSQTTKHTTFNLKNTGNYPLLIQEVSTSCGCTIAKYDKKPVLAGQTTSIILDYKPNSLGYFHKTADVICNVPEGYVRLKISGEVVEK